MIAKGGTEEEPEADLGATEEMPALAAAPAPPPARKRCFDLAPRTGNGVTGPVCR